MRILHVIESLEFGGAEKVVVGLANRMSGKAEVTVCLVKYRGELAGDLVSDVDLVCFDMGEGLHLGLAFKLAALVKQKRVDVINVHNWAIYPESVLAAVLARRGRVVQTVHGPYTDYGDGKIQRSKRWLRHVVERRLTRLERVAKIVTVSDAIGQYVESDIGIGPDKLLTIHNGIPSTCFEPVKHEGRVGLITVGRLARIKNHRLMIDAFATCLNRINDIFLTIVGDGPLRDELEDYVSRLGLSDQVQLTGFRDDIAELLAGHDIFLLSSNYEGISIALLEAMSLARPAIATDVGGIPETILPGKTGIIVPAGDRQALAAAIIDLAGSPGLRLDLGLNARAHFLAHFHEDIMDQRYLELYEACLSSAGESKTP